MNFYVIPIDCACGQDFLFLAVKKCSSEDSRKVISSIIEFLGQKKSSFGADPQRLKSLTS